MHDPPDGRGVRSAGVRILAQERAGDALKEARHIAAFVDVIVEHNGIESVNDTREHPRVDESQACAPAQCGIRRALACAGVGMHGVPYRHDREAEQLR